MENIGNTSKKSLLQTENVANIGVPPPLHVIMLQFVYNSK